MMLIEKSNVDKYKYCRSLILEAPSYMKEFSLSYPNEYKFLNRVYAARSKLRKICYVLSACDDIYFCALTFNDLKDSNSVKYKRKECFEFLNKVFRCFVLVEEYGETYGRYHVHAIGTYLSDESFEIFKSWHSRQNIKKVRSINVVCDLVNYVCKDVPRLRKNKKLINLMKDYDKLRRMPYNEKYRLELLKSTYIFDY